MFFKVRPVLFLFAVESIHGTTGPRAGPVGRVINEIMHNEIDADYCFSGFPIILFISFLWLASFNGQRFLLA